MKIKFDTRGCEMIRSKIIIILLLIAAVISTCGCVEEAPSPAPLPVQQLHATQTVSGSKTMTFGVTIDSACYHHPGHNYGPIDQEGSKKEVDVAKDLGVDFIRIDIRNETIGFSDEMQKLDEIIGYARSKDLKIYIGVYGMEGWLASIFTMFFHPDGGDGKASWDEFKEMYTGEARYLAERYHPDYMMIMVECPLNIGNQVHSVRTTEEWVEYTKETAKMIKTVSPDSKIILNEIVRTRSRLTNIAFVEAIMDDNSPDIDIIGIDPYSYDELDDEVSNIVRLRDQYNWHGDIWVGETNIFGAHAGEEEHQKNYFTYAVSLASENGFDGFCIFYLRDGTGTTDNQGILNEDFTEKAAYSVVKEAAKGLNV